MESLAKPATRTEHIVGQCSVQARVREKLARCSVGSMGISPLSQYESQGVLGEGTYGVVMKCRHRATGRLVAIKRFKDTDDKDQVLKTASREVNLLGGLRHANIVHLLDHFYVRRKLYLVFEYVEGTVLQVLDRHPNGLGDLNTRKIMWQLVRAIQHLHSINIVHRDVKPENMLISNTGMLKLCDFGFARYLSSPVIPGDMSDYVATRWYRAPELLVGDRGYGPAVDVWAIGCMLVEIQTGLPIFPGATDVDQLWMILRSLTSQQLASLRGTTLAQRMKVPSPAKEEVLDNRFAHLGADALEFLKACLHPHPACRKTCQDLLQMPYFYGASSWFPKGFFHNEQPARTSPERGRSKSRRYRQKGSTSTAPAPNISPYRVQHLEQQSFGCQPSRPVKCLFPDSDIEMAVEPDARFTDADSPHPHTGLVQVGKNKSKAIHLEARAGPEDPGIRYPINGVGPDIDLTVSNAQHSFGRVTTEPVPIPQRTEHLSDKTQGNQRHGSQFQSPDPRWRRPDPANGSSLFNRTPNRRQHGPANGSQRAPSSLHQDSLPSHKDDRMEQSPHVAGSPYQFVPPRLKSQRKSRIPAYYGASPPRGSDYSQASSLAADLAMDHMSPHSLPTPSRVVGPVIGPRAAVQHSCASNAGQFRSPLRAQAAPFVPASMQMQGKRAELHQSSY